MLHCASRGIVFLCAVTVVALVVDHKRLTAAPHSETEKTAAGKPAAQKRTAKKPVADSPSKPRMPAFFSQVVDDKQRAKIVAIQQELGPPIQQKRAELQALLDRQEAACFKVLSPEQRRQVETLRQQAKARRSPGGDEEPMDDQDNQAADAE